MAGRSKTAFVLGRRTRRDIDAPNSPEYLPRSEIIDQSISYSDTQRILVRVLIRFFNISIHDINYDINCSPARLVFFALRESLVEFPRETRFSLNQ